MRKIVLFVLLSFLTAASYAQIFTCGPVYNLPERDILNLTRFHGMDYYNIALRGKFNGRNVVIREVSCIDSRVASRDIEMPPIDSDTLLLTAISQIIDSTHARVAILDYYCIPRADRTFAIASGVKQHILMETDLPSGSLAGAYSLPIIAFTSGIEVKRKMGGSELTGVDYCGLRDAKIHPSKWGEKFGIKDYIYFELIIK